MQEKELYMKRIAGTLKHGRFQYVEKKSLWIGYALITLICIGGMIALLVTIFHNPTSYDDIVSIVLGAIGIVVGFSLLPIALLIIFIPNEKKKKEIELWLEDSVELKAYVQLLDSLVYITSPTVYRIGVKFHFEGKRLFRESRDKATSVPKGYNCIWKKYVDKKVDILYSPKYDEVMILKPDGSIKEEWF